MIRGVVAVLAGFAVFIAALVAMAAITGPVDAFGTRAMVLWVAWEAIGMAAAGFAVASIARRAPVGHAVVMGAIQTALTLGVFLTANDQSSPAWFWISAMVLMTPGAWFGAWLQRALAKRGRRQSSQERPPHGQAAPVRPGARLTT